MIEIERKFLVQGDFKSLATSHTHITQGYICSGHGRTVRIRIRDDKGYLTIKGPARYGHMGRYEFEKLITLDEAQNLMALAEGPLIDKVRYLVPWEGHTFEVDEFFGDNEGLIMAEVELQSPDEPFQRPPFLGLEVTDDRRYYNGSLRTYPYKDWK